jgi:aldose sugar dehydrogenase
MVKSSLFGLFGAIGIISCTATPSLNPESTTTQKGTYVKNTKVKRTGVNVTQLYNETCAKCHGKNAEGGGGGTPSLLTVDKFDQKWDKPFFDATRNGVPSQGMEGYGDTLSDEEIWALVVHIRELQDNAVRKMTAPKANGDNYTSKLHNYKLETIVNEQQGLKTPWSMTWLPDGTMLVSNRPGYMSIVRGGSVVGQVRGLPTSVEVGQGGLMEVKAHPKYKENGWLYLSIADPNSPGSRSALTKIVRGKLTFQGSDATWTNEQTIFKADNRFYTSAGVHFGSKIVFDGKGKIFFSIGERGEGMGAQDLSRPAGKIYRVNEDGSVPTDNPFVRTPGAIPQIWSYGHRNPQGLVQSLDGQLWDTEHAPRGGDELNQIKKGKNYGWPVISYGINYNDSSASVPWPTADQDIEMPLFRWIKSIGASGLAVADGKAFPNWKGDLIAGGLSGNNVDRFRIKDGKLLEKETILLWKGRVRDIQVGPDGFIYVLLNGPDKIVRLVPTK